ncbi:MAG: hypothetical protein PVH73_01775 [Candidatus Bathyarchaeota archaeon]
MTWSIVMLFVFSSVSFAIATQWPHLQQRENETQTVATYVEPLKLNEESELQDSNETIENEGSELEDPNETIENKESEFEDPNETAENEESQLPTGFESPPDFEVGEVRAIGVAIYSDSSINDPLSSIDWGNLQPGVNKTIDCYIHNTGNTATVLTLGTDNWNPPEAATYITLTWDYHEETVNIDEVIPVTLTLTISENIQEIAYFFFDITIVGIGI